MPRLTFTDYDAYAEAVRNVSVRMRVCSRQVSKWTYQYASVGSIMIQRVFEGGGSIAEGVNGGDVWSFYFQTHPCCANGQTLGEDEVFAAPPGHQFCLACKPSHEWHSVHIPARLLFPPQPEFGFASRASARVLKPPPEVTRRFKFFVQRALAVCESEPRLSDSPFAVDSCRDELVSAARELFANCGNAEGRHFERWRAITGSTLAWVIGNSEPSLSITELARQVGVPERTLRTAFLRSYGISPQEYLRIQRLNEARRLLLASGPERTTVTRIAFDLGFWDLGRFAGRYNALFGEHPSETLRRDGTNRRETGRNGQPADIT